MAFEGLRDKWEHMAPRERFLAMLLGTTAVVCLFAMVGITIRNGLSEIEERNYAAREALDALEIHRLQQAQARPASSGPKISYEAPSLSTYLEEISEKVEVALPSYQPQKKQTRGSYQEISGSITLRGLSIEELAAFLEMVESKNRTVVVSSLEINGGRRDPETLDSAKMTVSTWQKIRAAGSPDEADEAGGADEEEGEN